MSDVGKAKVQELKNAEVRRLLVVNQEMEIC